jgi:hypothetical protein
MEMSYRGAWASASSWGFVLEDNPSMCANSRIERMKSYYSYSSDISPATTNWAEKSLKLACRRSKVGSKITCGVSPHLPLTLGSFSTEHASIPLVTHSLNISRKKRGEGDSQRLNLEQLAASMYLYSHNVSFIFQPTALLQCNDTQQPNPGLRQPLTVFPIIFHESSMRYHHNLVHDKNPQTAGTSH